MKKPTTNLSETQGSSVSEVTLKVLQKLKSDGELIPSRNGGTLELRPHSLILDNNVATTCLAHRNNNVFATIAETLWVWAGRNDVTTLQKWLPRAPDYSDDWSNEHQKGTWRAGYGKRVMKFPKQNSRETINQLAVVHRRLNKDISTRQALITIPNPGEDYIEGSKDYPCNLIVHFLVRDGKVDMFVDVRSNDVIFGVCINMFEWSFVWDYIVSAFNLTHGKYYHRSHSMHLYDWKGKTVDRMLENSSLPPVFESPDTGLGRLSPYDLMASCEEIYSQAGMKADFDNMPLRLRDFGKVLYAETILSQDDEDAFVNFITEIKDPNLQLSVLDIGQRRLKKPLYSHPELDKVLGDNYHKMYGYLQYLYSA